MMPPACSSEPFSKSSLEPATPTLGTLSKVSASSSNHRGRTSVSLLRKSRYLPRASEAPALQESTKPWFFAFRIKRTAPDNTNSANRDSSAEPSSTMMISKLHVGRLSEIDLRQL